VTSKARSFGVKNFARPSVISNWREWAYFIHVDQGPGHNIWQHLLCYRFTVTYQFISTSTRNMACFYYKFRRFNALWVRDQGYLIIMKNLLGTMNRKVELKQLFRHIF
jgi:hypothetical protein